MAENVLSWNFFTCFWIFVRQTKIAITRPIFKNFAYFFLHGASLYGFHFCFWKQSNPTWNDWDMSKLCSTGVFAPSPESSAQDPPWIGLTDNVRYLPILTNIAKYCQKCSNIIRNCLIMIMWLDFFYSLIFPQCLKDVSRVLDGYCTIYTNIVGYCEIMSDTNIIMQVVFYCL